MSDTPMVTVKPGVRLRGLSPAMCIAHSVVSSAMLSNGVHCIITSATDGLHSRGSWHHCGEALDYRTSHIAPELLRKLVSQIAKALGPHFDVVLEPTHLHVEHDDR